MRGDSWSKLFYYFGTTVDEVLQLIVEMLMALVSALSVMWEMKLVLADVLWFILGMMLALSAVCLIWK